ncbi:RNA polymerase sigma-70 factor (ECF subfamily) [Eilatimonas milleporae]|uniref:RNA polymerase sigma-70 factor (ECF subfamily) n=2 Tax=Eilatimonas milleporae TaxID=911205 RepID=A0A3M0CFP2_9PROT|nr:RNA polymerase sigma-70 factor (ECF subfamily) [Eilatimonas milleporae]
MIDHMGKADAVSSFAKRDEDCPGGTHDAAAEDPLAVLYHEYRAELSAGIRRLFGDGPPDPDDVAQDAFHKVYERGDTASIRNLKAFLWRTARNIVLVAKRKDDIRSKLDFEVEQLFFPLKGDISTPETIIIAKEQLRAINDLLRSMPEKRRRALMLYRVEGLPLVEVARRLGISRTAVTKHISRAQMQINALFLDASGD